MVGGSPASPMVSDPPSGTTGVLDVLLGSPAFDLSRPTPTSSDVASSGVPDCPASQDLSRSPGPVPSWRLAREGPFLSERSPSAPNCFGDDCSFRHTTYRSSDYTRLSGKVWCSVASSPVFRVDWRAGVCQSSEDGPGMWLHSLSREQAIDAAHQLHRDVCLMTTNLDVLDQYVLCLQGTASKILELSLESRDFPSEAVAASTMGPRARRAAVQMEAMGLWRPSLGSSDLPVNYIGLLFGVVF